jgi:hypothetical protein
VAQSYRKDFWERPPDYIEVFCEKDAMSGVLEPVTEKYDVHILPIRGDCSETLCQRIGMEWRRITKHIYCYYFGDHDPKGFTIEKSFRRRVEGYAEKPVTWIRLAVTQADYDNESILGFDLKENPKTRSVWQPYKDQFGTRCIEVDAIPATEIRRRLVEAIESHIDQREWEILQLIEAEEKKDLLDVIRGLGTIESPAAYEIQLDTRYPPDGDPIWNAEYEAAVTECEQHSKRIEQRCVELGIGTRFRPSLHPLTGLTARNSFLRSCGPNGAGSRMRRSMKN